MNSDQNKRIIEEARLQQMKLAILKLERENTNTRELTNTEMVTLLKNLIIQYADRTV